jgi:hypothetical protein
LFSGLSSLAAENWLELRTAKMSLIIGVRCKDGCLAIADFRNRIDTDGIIKFEDNFEKVVKHDDYLLYNHGYNRIQDNDWKLRWQDLTPYGSNPVYKDILSEMRFKPDKSAFYVFISKDRLSEISIDVKNGVKRIDHLPNDRIVSGSGSKYVVDLNLLENLRKRKCKKVYKGLRNTFKKAYSLMSFGSGNEFSKQHKIYELVSYPG